MKQELPLPAPAAAIEIELQPRSGPTPNEMSRQAEREIFSRPQVYNYANVSPTTPARARNILISE